MRSVVILATQGVQLLDVSGPLDVFAQANVQAGRAFYRLRLLSTLPGPLDSSSGVRLLPDGHLGAGEAALTPVDTLLVAGAPRLNEAGFPPTLLAWLRGAASSAGRYGSICSGAFLLAAAGLLDGRRVTTHWAHATGLATRYPTVRVDPDALFVADGPVRTAAGVTAGMDLALALVEEDLGRDVAMGVAAQLVIFFKRPGGQAQFSRGGEAAPVGRSVFQELQRWVTANPAHEHSVAALAARAGLSPRHFARLFRAEVGMTPAAFVEKARVEAARRLLEGGHETPKRVAAQCGFANADTLRRTFTRHVGVTPADYRRAYVGGHPA